MPLPAVLIYGHGTTNATESISILVSGIGWNKAVSSQSFIDVLLAIAVGLVDHRVRLGCRSHRAKERTGGDAQHESFLIEIHDKSEMDREKEG